MLSAETPFFCASKGQQGKPNGNALLHPEGDHLSLLSMYTQWKKQSSRFAFAREHGLNHTALERAGTIRDQLKDLIRTSWGLQQISSCGGPKNYVVVRRCLLKACFTQTARLDEMNRNSYT